MQDCVRGMEVLVRVWVRLWKGGGEEEEEEEEKEKDEYANGNGKIKQHG